MWNIKEEIRITYNDKMMVFKSTRTFQLKLNIHLISCAYESSEQTLSMNIVLYTS